jgi:hypothetical protein
MHKFDGYILLSTKALIRFKLDPGFSYLLYNINVMSIE